MKTMCADGGLRAQPPGVGAARAPARPRLGRQQPAPPLGVGDAETRREEAKRLGWPRGGRQGGGGRGAATPWGAGAGTQPGLPGPQLRPRAQEQIVLGGGGGSGPPRSQAENQQREAAGERGRGAAERSLAAAE